MRCHLVRVGDPHGYPTAARRIDDLAWVGLPVDPDALTATTWQSPSRAVAAWSWSNEPTSGQHSAREGRTLSTGYPAPPDDVPLDELPLAGTWARASLRDASALASTSRSGVEPWFVGAGDEGSVWIANRASLVHVGARGRVTPDLDQVALVGLANAGYLVSDRTPYVGVRALPAGSSVEARWDPRRGAVQERVHPPATVAGSGDPADVAAALVDAAAEAGDLGQQRAGITGGRDSRLVLGALVAAGHRPTAFTRGAASDPDVVVGAQVAQTLGLTHDRVTPRGQTGDSTAHVDALERLSWAVVRSEGQLTAYDASGGAGTRFRAAHAALSGTGGETLRGGFASTEYDAPTPGAGIRWLERLTTGNLALTHPDLHDAYRADVAPWFDALKQDPLTGLNAFFLEHRQARWFGASRLSTSLAATPRTILLDDAVLAAAAGVPVVDLVEETLVREVLRHLEPRLLDVPFVGRRLRCDGEARRGPDPVPAAKGRSASFSWKVHFDAPLAAVLHREASRGAFVDEAALGRLDPAGPATGADARARWALATAGSLHDPAWYDRRTRFERDPEMVHVTARRVEPSRSTGPGSRTSQRARRLLDLARRDPRRVPGAVLRAARRAHRR